MDAASQRLTFCIWETASNLAELRHLAATQAATGWVWITPPTVNGQIAAAFPHFQ